MTQRKMNSFEVDRLRDFLTKYAVAAPSSPPEGTPVVAAADPNVPVEDAIGELLLADYLVFLLALDTYFRYLEEKSGEADAEDALGRRGIQLLKQSDNQADILRVFTAQNLPTDAHKKMLARAFSILPNGAAGISRRALLIRTLLNRGGSATLRAIFQKNKALQQVREGLTASAMVSADEALKVLAAFPLRNKRLAAWIDDADAAVGPDVPVLISPVEQATRQSQDTATDLMKQSASIIASPSAEEEMQAQEERTAAIEQIQRETTEQAKRSLERNGEEDGIMTRSETIGVAVAAAMQVVTDPSNPRNVPPSLSGLDDDQLAAALTDGRTVVFAGAGGGKSTTLAARLAYLVKDRKQPPGRILATSFNKKAADELREKIRKVVGKDALDQMTVGTMHATFTRFIKKYGTPAEARTVERPERGGRFMGDGKAIAREVQKIWEVCFKKEDLEKAGKPPMPMPRLKNAVMARTKWITQGVTPAAAKEIDFVFGTWYQMYEGIKGTIPGWRPPCPSRSYDGFMARHRPDGHRLGDFTDQLLLFRDILRRNPAVKKEVQSLYDHILVDEAQDRNPLMAEIVDLMSEHITDGSDGKSLWIVGDDKQCVAVDTKISTPTGEIAAGDLRAGNSILAFRNSDVTPQTVKHVTPSSWTWGYRITTSSGKTLTMSPNHRIWASAISPEKGGHLVYLMYRPDLGFRVGVTLNGQTETGRRSSTNRMTLENVDSLWVLEHVQDYEQALLLETSYSLEYGVPTSVFNGMYRNLNQDRLNSLFERFGQNGLKLLAAKNYDFNLPHTTAYASSNGRRQRRVIQLLAHHSKGNIVSFEWTGNDLDEKIGDLATVTPAKGEDRRRVRRFCNNYRDALAFAFELQKRTGALLNRRLSAGLLEEEPLPLIQASGLFPGMSVMTLNDDHEIETDEIVDVQKVDAKFVDLDVDDASNFFGGGILSHNSINSFQGAKSEIFKALHNKPGWKTRVIRTNYRCEPEIVEAGNKLIAHNERSLPIPQVPDPSKKKGVGSIEVSVPGDEASAALRAVEEIKHDASLGEPLSNNAILCRTNAELNSYETACIIRGVRYIRRGKGSFLTSPESTAMLGYVQLVTGTDFEKAQSALVDVINQPNRFWLSAGQEPLKLGIKAAFDEYARYTDQDRRAINPLRALKNATFRGILAKHLAKLTKSGKGWRFEDKLEDMGDSLEMIRARALSDDKYTTKDLFDEILTLKGEKVEDGKFVEQTFRESLQTLILDKTGEDDDDDTAASAADNESLGNVSFLYKLAEPDPTDEDDAINPPTTTQGFAAKMARYKAKANDLKIDVDKWAEDQAKPGATPEEAPPGVVITTVHAVKGAQWKKVFVQMPKGKFPLIFTGGGKKDEDGASTPSSLEPSSSEQMEEERQLAYVALTRAAKDLRILCPSRMGDRPAGVSDFVYEAGLAPPAPPPPRTAPASPEAQAPNEPSPLATDPEALRTEETLEAVEEAFSDGWESDDMVYDYEGV